MYCVQSGFYTLTSNSSLSGYWKQLLKEMRQANLDWRTSESFIMCMQVMAERRPCDALVVDEVRAWSSRPGIPIPQLLSP